MRIALACPACGETSEQGFDIAAYLWADVNDWALRTVADVHLLASRYGWREDDILSMSAFRRRVYLRMIES